jgi:hypothetical protein
VIRQAITCDVCGSEKRQTNHWFVAYELGGELRVSGWGSRRKLKAATKHLCGQTCLHKLVDDFMARSIDVRSQRIGGDEPALTSTMDTSLTSPAAYENLESNVRLLNAAEAEAALTVQRLQAKFAVVPRGESAVAAPISDEPRFSSATWRAEAWERERERELRAAERRPDIARRRQRA